MPVPALTLACCRRCHGRLADLKAIYAYLSVLPQTTACNTVQNGCSGCFGDARGRAKLAPNRYRYANSDDCPNNYFPVSPAKTGEDGLPYGVSPPQLAPHNGTPRRIGAGL